MPLFEVTTTEQVTRRYTVRARGSHDAHTKVQDERPGYDTNVEVFLGDEKVVRALEIQPEVKG